MSKIPILIFDHIGDHTTKQKKTKICTQDVTNFSPIRDIKAFDLKT